MLNRLSILTLAGLSLLAPVLAKTPCDKVTAFQIKDKTDLIAGPKADGRVGDFKICNAQISAVIEGARNSNGYHPYGGMVVDLVQSHGKAEDLYDKAFPIITAGGNIFGLRTVQATGARVEVGNGEAKVIVEAVDASFSVIESFINRPIPSHGFKFRIEYILKDNSKELLTRIYTETNRKSTALVGIGMGFFGGDGLSLLGPKYGYNTGAMVRKFTDYLAATTEKTSYAWVSPKKSFKAIFPYNTSVFGGYQDMQIPPGGKTPFDFYTLVGDGDMEAIRLRAEEIRFAKKPDAGTVLKAKVKQGGGQPTTCEGIPVYLLKKEGEADSFFSMGRVSATCEVSFSPPQGRYRIVAGEIGLGAWGDQEVTVGKTSVDITMDRPVTGVLKVHVTEKGKTGTQPANYTISPQFDLPDLPLAVGRSTRMGQYTAVIPQGFQYRPLTLRAGNYSLRVTRGFEYSVYSGSVQIPAGSEKKADITLDRQVTRPGWMTTDYHLHFMPSMDSDHSMEDGMLAVLANGLEIPVTTDHNVVTDPFPTIKKLQLEQHLKGVVGLEMTTYSTGHFNVFPLKYDHEALNHGFDVPDWYKLLVPELFSRMRGMHDKDMLVQINHGRGGKGGYFSAAQLDPTTGLAKNKALMPDDVAFDLMEILNNPRTDRMGELLRDWESFMRRGKRIVMTGVSDTHDYIGLDVGLCRSYVFLGTNDVKKVTDKLFRDNTKAGRVIVSCGQWINMEAVQGNKVIGKIGDTVKMKKGKATFKIQVKAAEWIGATKILVMVNGLNTAKTIEIPQKPGAIDFTTTVTLDLEKDSYVWASVQSPKPLAPHYAFGEATSLTNPIFFDLNGDGVWKP